MTDRELLALCTMIHSHNDKAVDVAREYISHEAPTAMEYHYRQHCLNSLSQVTDLHLAGNGPHREFDC